nr:glycoprotein hormone beta-5 [Zootoca vivipara]
MVQEISNKVWLKMKLPSVVQGSLLLFILASWAGAPKPPSINLQTFTGCAVREFTFLAKKPGCKAMRITTDSCWGRCQTWEKPVLKPPYIEAHHRVCTYNETKLETVKLPNCAANVSPFYTYLKAIRCDCGMCLTETTECETA